jgi:hypothetical protein
MRCTVSHRASSLATIVICLLATNCGHETSGPDTASVPSPTPTSSPTPGGVSEFLLLDDFTSNIDRGWIPVVGDWRIENEEMVLRSEDGADEFMFVGDGQWTDYTLETDLKYSNGALTNEFGIVFFADRYLTSCYHFRLSNLSGGREVELRFSRDRRTESADLIARAIAPSSFESGVWYKLKVVTKQGRIRCFVNGNPLIDVRDLSRSNGLVGLMSDGFSAVLHFDNVRVYRTE